MSCHKDALDSKGLGALHRRVLQQEVLHLSRLLHAGAEVDLRSQPSEGPSRTPLGLAACCVEDEDGEKSRVGRIAYME